MPEPASGPAPDCLLCPRLVTYRRANQARNPEWFNGPVPSFGQTSARLLIVGMAPGVRGANRTGRPFTGDDAGILLYQTLMEYGFASGTYQARLDHGLILQDCRIVNAVRCVPPANLPVRSEITTCNRFLQSELAAMASLRVVVALGLLAHAAVLRAVGVPPSRIKFVHGKIIPLKDGILLADSYHVSRYNTNTGRLTAEMFRNVVADVAGRLDG